MMTSLLLLIHLVGLALAVGAATVKLKLVFKCLSDSSFVSVFTRVTKLITRFIVIGMILLTLSGISWLVQGYPITGRLMVKLVLFGTLWVLGPLIDNVFEPRFVKLAPGPAERASPAFARAQKQHLIMELVATLLFYAILVVWTIS